MTRSCAHPTCRTSLDGDPIECPHGLPFCEHCTWEDGCIECRTAHFAAIWDTALDNPMPAWTPDDEWAGFWGERRKEDKDYIA